MAVAENPYSVAWPKFSAEIAAADWLPIKYWNYWDFVRSFSVVWQETVFVFDTPFLEEEDEWANYFDVSRYKKTEETSESAFRPAGVSIGSWRVAVSDVTLDKTRKSFLDPSILTKLLVSPHQAGHSCDRV